MTDHAGLLRQIRADARPYVEQALDLAEVFTGFRKLASENGLDWGVIKALIKAELQDEKDGGTEKVERIIEKADFASAYADMLGLGAKMNEKNFSDDPFIMAIRAAGEAMLSNPPHDSSTGELIEEQNAPGPSNRDLSADGEPSSAAAPQGEAAHAGTGSETLADHEGHSQGEAENGSSDAVSASPPFPDVPAFLDRRRVA